MRCGTTSTTRMRAVMLSAASNSKRYHNKPAQMNTTAALNRSAGHFTPNRFLRKPYVASSLNRMENFFMSRVVLAQPCSG